jgi:hypothetical protein
MIGNVMRRDKADYVKGMFLHGEPGPTAPPPFSRRDLVKAGDFLVSDSGSTVLCDAKIRDATPLDDVKRRLDNLQRRIEQATEAIRRSRSRS